MMDKTEMYEAVQRTLGTKILYGFCNHVMGYHPVWLRPDNRCFGYMINDWEASERFFNSFSHDTKKSFLGPRLTVLLSFRPCGNPTPSENRQSANPSDGLTQPHELLAIKLIDAAEVVNDFGHRLSGDWMALDQSKITVIPRIALIKYLKNLISLQFFLTIAICRFCLLAYNG